MINDAVILSIKTSKFEFLELVPGQITLVVAELCPDGCCKSHLEIRANKLTLNPVNAMPTSVFSDSSMQKSISKQLVFCPFIDELVKKDYPYRKISKMVDFEANNWQKFSVHAFNNWPRKTQLI